MKKNIFKGKNILITGINGFVGSHLSHALKENGANVWGISHSLKKRNIIKANIIDYTVIDNIIKKKKIDICFHLAAESLVESGQEDPYHTFKINILGTLNILESARKNNLERVIIASTAHVYGDNPLPYKEEYAPKPSRPYETSKTSIDLIAQSYADTFNLPVLIPRFSNIYGPGDLNFNRLIPKTIKSILENDNPKMWGGGAIRDYVFIEDAINGYLKLANLPISSLEKNRIFNFGTGNRMSVRQVMDAVIQASGKNAKIEKIEDSRALEIKKQYVSSAKARRILHWRPKVSMEKGLIKTIVWYEKYFESI
jgi:CDP-glucose 4,6-dehydratase